MHRPDHRWKPILEGARAESAARLLDDFDSVLGGLLDEASGAGEAAAMQPQLSYSMSDGCAGYALFYAYRHLHGGTRRDLEHCNQALMLAAESLGRVRAVPALYGGLSGTAWVIQHLSRVLPEGALDSRAELLALNEEVDEFLLQWLRQGQDARDYDLIRGLVGIGVYCLERLPAERARVALEEIVRQLAATALASEHGLYWLTPHALVPPNQAAHFPDGYYNLGVAHGIPGIVAFLTHVHSAGVAPAETARLLRGATRWALQQRLPEAQPSDFAAYVSTRGEMQPTRLAWCYGDAGVAVTLFASARCLDDAEIHAEAMRTAYKAARRALQDSGVADASFCHGAYGLAHIFNRLHQETGDPLFLERALFWFDHGAALRKPEAGQGGYVFWEAGPDGELGWRPVPGLLMGLSGIGLAALAGISRHTPGWDRLFLLDTPAGGAA